MLDFYFYNAFELEDLEKDPNLSIFHKEGDRRLFIELVDKGNTAGWLHFSENCVYGIEGHDAMIPIALYLYEKYNNPFYIDDYTYFDENSTIKDCFREMLMLFKGVDITKEPYKSLYEKIKGEYNKN